LFVCFVLLESVANAEAVRFKNGKWFDGNSFALKTAFSVNGILSFRYRGKIDSTVDLKGKFVIAPFAEAHTHQFLDVMDFNAQIDEYLRRGIFYAKNLNSLPRLTVRSRPYLNRPEGPDVSFAGGGLTASGGHPVQIFDGLAATGQLPGFKVEEMLDEAYFLIDTEGDLTRKWPSIQRAKSDFIKTYLEYSEQYEARKSDPAYYGRRGLDPKLLPSIVRLAHKSGLRVSVHIASAGDFHNAVSAGVDEISHLAIELIAPSDATRAAKKKIDVVTTTLSHRDTSGIADLDAIHKSNLKLLHSTGVKLAIGTDNMPAGAVEEAENINRLNVFDNVTLLKIWTENTPLTIFPTRKIGRLRDGWEASFLALEGDPIIDFSNIRKIGLRYKQGQLINRRKN